MDEADKILQEALRLHQEANTYIEPVLLDLLVRMASLIRENKQRLRSLEVRDRKLA